jgi:hypothetical protein
MDHETEVREAMREPPRTPPSRDMSAPTPAEEEVSRLMGEAWAAHRDAADALERFVHRPGGAAGARLRALRLLARAVRCDAQVAGLKGGQ